MSISLEDLMSQIDDYKEEQAKSTKREERAKWAFPPNGDHEGRFIVDPVGNLYEKFTSFGYGFNGVRAIESLKEPELSKVPAEWRETDPLRDLYWSDNGGKDYGLYKYSPKKNFLVYFYLMNTSSPSDNWKPGNLYCLVGNQRLEAAYMKMVESFAKDAANEIQKTLSPNEEGLVFQISFTGGSQGNCSIQPKFPNKIAGIDLKGQVYVPLSEAYIGPEFSQEKYSKMISRVTEELAEARRNKEEWKAKNAAAGGESQPSVTETVVQDNSSQTQAPAQTQAAEQPAEVKVETVAPTPVAEQTQPAQQAPNIDADPLAKYRKQS